MLAPKKAKYRKWQSARRGERRTNSADTRGITVAFGSYGLKALTQARVTSNQIEAARRALSRASGMGSGKGDVAGYVFDVRPGRVIFEIDGAVESVAREALRKAGTKLPLSARVVARH